jgi:hypothetical protein
MYVRLAFAVAAHLEPEILIVDEVLAVGDAEFQKKCLGKMAQVAEGGRTVLFVSHNMAAVERLCSHSIYLDSGVLVCKGSTDAVVTMYVKDRHAVWNQVTGVKVQDGLMLEQLQVMTEVVRSGDPMEIEIRLLGETAGRINQCAVLVYSARGARIGMIDARESGVLPIRYGEGRFAIRVRVHSLALVEGSYSLGVYFGTDKFVGDIFDLAELSVIPAVSPFPYTPYAAEIRGPVALNAETSILFNTSGQLRADSEVD